MQPESQMHRRLIRNVSAEAGARVIYLATRFFIPPFVLARVGMEAYGLYGTVFMLVAYFGISALGFSNAYIRYVAQFSASGETDRANRLLSTGLTLMTVLGVVCFSAFSAGWPLVANWIKVPNPLGHDGRILAFLIVGIFFAYLAGSVYRDALTGLQQIERVQKIWTASFLLETVLIFGFVGAGYGLPGLGMAFVLRTLFDLGGHWYIAYKQIPWLRIRFIWPDRESLRLLIRYGGIVQLNSMLAIFLSSVERVIAAPLLGLSACGLLDIGKRFPSMATSIPSAFASSVLPSASDLHARSGSEGLFRLYLSTSRYMSMVSATLFAFLCVFATPTLHFWLQDIPAGATVVLILFSLASQVHMLTGPGTSIVKAMGKPHLEFHYSLANVAAIGLLVPASRFVTGGWSITSIASTVSLATLVSATWFLWVANRELRQTGSSFAKQVLMPAVIPYIAAALVGWPLLSWFEPHTRWESAALLVVGGLLYMITLAVLMALTVATDMERDVLHTVANRWLKRSYSQGVALPLNS